MKNYRTLLLSMITAFAFTNATAQDSTSVEKPAKEKTRWTLGLSGVVVDDDGKPFNDLFDVNNSWQFLPVPSRLSLDATLCNNWSIEGAFTFVKYSAGKLVNDVKINEDHTLISFDANAKYHFLNHRIFDPFTVSGLGFTYRSVLQEQTPTLNLGLGANIWIYKGLGLNVQSKAKFKLNSKSSNYLIHTLGLVYRLN